VRERRLVPERGVGGPRGRRHDIAVPGEIPGNRGVSCVAEGSGSGVSQGRERRRRTHLPHPRARIRAAPRAERTPHLAAAARPLRRRRRRPVARLPPEPADGSGMRVRGNDYRPLNPPAEFTPELRVSVVIPAYGGQEKLDLVLAGLARQTYPADLTEVIVVDNGSEPPLRLPDDRPQDTRIVRCDTPGRGHARNAGLAEAKGDVIHWLDSDVVPTPGSLTAHMRWHHTAPYLAVTGYLRFTEAPLPEKLPDDLEAYFEPAEPHAWIVKLVDRTDGLTRNTERPFSLHVGGSTSVNARLIEAAGPMDGDLVLGQDTEMGYRLMQAGAVFVPEPRARAYHL